MRERFEIRTSWQEVRPGSRLDFVVIGAGQVLKKYLDPAVKQGELNISQILSLEPLQDFAQKHPQYSDRYTQVTDIPQILDRLSTFPDEALNIIAVTPASGRLELTEAVLDDPRLAHSRVYVEKPYATSLEEITRYEELVRQHSNRMHFATRFADSRSDLIIKNLSPDRIPQNIVCHFVEGLQQYQQVKQNPRHYYLNDGPESDLGFHLLHTVAALAEKLGGYYGFEILDVTDLNDEQPEQFEEKGMGVRCDLAVLIGDPVLPLEVSLTVGKGNGKEDKRLVLNFKEGSIIQRYGNDEIFRDLVTSAYDGTERISFSHDARYGDFTKAFRPENFGQQSERQQLIALDVARVCFEMKRIRVA